GARSARPRVGGGRDETGGGARPARDRGDDRARESRHTGGRAHTGGTPRARRARSGASRGRRRAMSELSPTARALFAAAKGDAPDPAVRDKIWDAVASTATATGAATGASAVASKAPAATSAAATIGGKWLLAIVLGGALSIGLA